MGGGLVNCDMSDRELGLLLISEPHVAHSDCSNEGNRYRKNYHCEHSSVHIGCLSERTGEKNHQCAAFLKSKSGVGFYRLNNLLK